MQAKTALLASELDARLQQSQSRLHTMTRLRDTEAAAHQELQTSSRLKVAKLEAEVSQLSQDLSSEKQKNQQLTSQVGCHTLVWSV